MMVLGEQILMIFKLYLSSNLKYLQNSIDINKVCDGKLDCGDESDEIDCEMISFGSSYKKMMPPNGDGMFQIFSGRVISRISYFDVCLGPIDIHIGLNLESISHIDELDLEMTVHLGIHLSWIDERLTFQKVHRSRLNKIISSKEKRELWIPEMIFENTHEKEKLILDDDVTQTSIRILQNAKGKMAPLTQVHNSKEYFGSEG